jgi:uncharacterized protein YndB with AHSA1/START domain
MEKPDVAERESLILTRVYPVAPEKLWRAWTDAPALRIWWNQADSPGWIGELDVRVGGRYRVVLRDPEGEYHDVRGVYREVVPNRKLVFTWNLHDGPPERESLVTVVLNATSAGTELVFRQEPIFDPRARDGWRGAFKRLGQFLQHTH